MDGFDTMTMGYLPSPLPPTGVQNPDYMSVGSGLDMQDQYSNFDTDPYLSGDDLAFAHSGSLGRPTALKRFSTGYSSSFDEPFPDPSLLPFDSAPPEPAAPESPSMERDHKLLSFSMPIFNFTLLDFSLRRTALTMSAQLHGMFFLAESQWPAPPDAPPPPPELTCYRRNLFQITGSVMLPRGLRYIMTDSGDRIPIIAQELAIFATESVEGNPVKIISVPWKTPTGSGPPSAEEKAEKEPPAIPLDTTAGSDLDADYATFPIQWKRLQFRIATANNGRRKELQQHFVIRLKVMATLSTGAKISVAESHSGAIIVRGRSPRNFQSRKDFPLGNSTSSRKHASSAVSRPSTGDSAAHQVTSAPKLTSSPKDVAPMKFSAAGPDNPAPASPEIADWALLAHPNVTDGLPTPNYTSGMAVPALTPYASQPSPDLHQYPPYSHPHVAAMSAPVSLSFSSDDEGGSPVPRPSAPRSRPPTSNPSPSHTASAKPRHPTTVHTPPPSHTNPPPRPRFHSQQPSSSMVPSVNGNFGQQVSASPIPQQPNMARGSRPHTPSDESAVDGLYEYFPLGLDDWMLPVESVYRPHFVHHETGGHGGVAGGVARAGPVRRKSKRYFSEDG